MISFRESLQNLLQEGLDRGIITHQELVFAGCQVVRTVLHLLSQDKNVPIIISETEKWCKNPTIGNANSANLDTAMANAYAIYLDSAYVARCVYMAAISTARAIGVSIATYNVSSVVFYVSVIENALIDSTREDPKTLAVCQQMTKKLLLSYLPRLNNLKLFL
jgi:hypothetical protein